MRVEARRMEHQGPRLRLRAVMAGLAWSLGLTLAAAAAISVALVSSPLTETHLPWLVNGLGFAAVFGGGFCSARRGGSLGWLHGGLTGLAYVACAYVLSVLVFAPVSPLGWPRAVFASLAGMTGGILGVNH